MKTFFGEVAWSIIDQATSSGTNFLLTAFAARSLAPAEFGAFALAFATYLLALGISRSLCSEPFTVRFSASEPDDFRAAAGQSVGAAGGLGVMLGAACIAAGVVVEGFVGACLSALGLGLPGLLVQDAWRCVFFASARARSAASNDLLWAAGQLLLIVFVSAGGHRVTAPLLILGWGCGAAVGAAFGVLQARLLPSPLGALRWWREHADLAMRFAGEFLAAAGAIHLVTFVLAATAGATAAGSIRGAHLLLGPLSMLQMAISIVFLPEAVRVAKTSLPVLVKRVRQLSLTLLTTGIVGGLAVLALPEAWGRQILGDSWLSTRAILPQMSIVMCGAGMAAGGMLGLRSLGAASRSLRARMTIIPITVVVGLSGALLAGVTGAANAFVLISLAGASIWWRAFLKAVHHERSLRDSSGLRQQIGIDICARAEVVSV